MQLLKKIKRQITSKLFGRPSIRALYELYDRRIIPYSGTVIFDVGANDGSNFINVAHLFPWVEIHAFEPTPFLVETIRKETETIKNYKLIPKAVSREAGTMLFNIAGQGDWGCSSLLEFSENLKETWPDRTDLRVTDRIEVSVITLKEYILEHKIDKIDFLNIDTQGTDLDVLESLEELLYIVAAGMIEVPHSSKVMLYKNQHTREEVEHFIKSNGFVIYKEKSQQNESNIYFKKK